jgi:hypothetical protein
MQMERKTSFGGRSNVAEFPQIETRGRAIREILADLADGMARTHACIHRGHLAQAERDAGAEAMREVLTRKVDAVAERVGALDARQTVMEGRVTTLAQMFGAAPVEDRDEPLPRPHVGMGWREHLKMVGTVLGSLGGAVLLYQLAWPAVLALHHAIMGAAT